MPITLMSVGDRVRILELRGSPELRKHLEDLGLTRGECVTVLSRNQGNIIIGIKDSRLALNEDTANKIRVELVS